jgi:hypothetical protein
MTVRSAAAIPAGHLERVRAEFSKLDPMAAIAEVRWLVDSGSTEREIVLRTGWGVADVCRALSFPRQLAAPLMTTAWHR